MSDVSKSKGWRPYNVAAVAIIPLAVLFQSCAAVVPVVIHEVTREGTKAAVDKTKDTIHNMKEQPAEKDAAPKSEFNRTGSKTEEPTVMDKAAKKGGEAAENQTLRTIRQKGGQFGGWLKRKARELTPD
jgi:hypothetical protein